MIWIPSQATALKHGKGWKTPSCILYPLDINQDLKLTNKFCFVKRSSIILPTFGINWLSLSSV